MEEKRSENKSKSRSSSKDKMTEAEKVKENKKSTSKKRTSKAEETTGIKETKSKRSHSKPRTEADKSSSKLKEPKLTQKKASNSNKEKVSGPSIKLTSKSGQVKPVDDKEGSKKIKKVSSTKSKESVASPRRASPRRASPRHASPRHAKHITIQETSLEIDRENLLKREKTIHNGGIHKSQLQREPTMIQNGQSYEMEEEEEDAYAYEDDFDSYEDDFEDSDEEDESSDKQVNTDIHELRSLISSVQTQRITSADANSLMPEKGSDSDTSESANHMGALKSRKIKTKSKKSSAEDRKSSQSRIDFSQATVDQRRYSALGGGRGTVLLNLITLDTVVYQVFQLAPIKDYEFYMQNFGNFNRIQKHTQTAEDSVEREVQTNEMDLDDKWTQMPPTDAKGYGGSAIIQSDVSDDSNSILQLSHIYTSVKFKRFVSRTGQVCWDGELLYLFNDLLGERSGSSTFQCENTSRSKLSLGFSQISLGPLAKDCTCQDVSYDDATTSAVAVFNISQSPVDELVYKCLVCVWHLNDLHVPKRVLLANGRGSCLCYSPSKTAVFCGMEDGSVVAWNLQDTSTSGEEELVLPWGENDELPVQHPSYTTANLNTDSNSYDSIVQIMPLTSYGSSDEDNYQIASLAANGYVQIWTALPHQSDSTDTIDLGLAPGSTLKMVPSSIININSKGFSSSSQLQAFCMTSSISEDTSGHILIGTDSGYIKHCVRHSNTPLNSLTYDLEAISDVLSLSTSPFDESVILAAFSDGSVRIYHLPMSNPVGEFRLESSNDPVKHVLWSLQSPYIFYSVHGDATLAVWDLKRNSKSPHYIENVEGSKVTGIDLMVGDEQISYMGVSMGNGRVNVYLLPPPTGHYSYIEDGMKLLKVINLL